MNYTLAVQVTGRLFGCILHRDADKGGFEHYLEALSTDQLSLSDAIYEFFTCEEFVSKFVLNDTPNQLVRKFLCTFFNADAITENSIETPLRLYVFQGLGPTIRFFLENPLYYKRYGSNSVPRYEIAHNLRF